jgi:hypothetical protein
MVAGGGWSVEGDRPGHGDAAAFGYQFFPSPFACSPASPGHWVRTASAEKGAIGDSIATDRHFSPPVPRIAKVRNTEVGITLARGISVDAWAWHGWPVVGGGQRVGQTGEFSVKWYHLGIIFVPCRSRLEKARKFKLQLQLRAAYGFADRRGPGAGVFDFGFSILDR